MSVAFDSNVTLTVEIGFADNPLTASPTWTDVSAYVRRFATRRGRSHELDQIRASTLRMTLDNSDGRFDPTYTSGAYYNNVHQMKQIRVRAAYSSTTYELFRGHITAWPQSWPQKKDATVKLVAVDGFRLLNQAYTATAEAQETSGTRIGNLLDDASWPATWRSIATGDVTVQAYTPACQAILGLIRTVADTEGGLFFIDGQARVVFQERSYRAGLSSVATFGDGAGELPYVGLILGYDDTQIWNRVEVASIGLALQVSENVSSQGLYGKRVLKLFDLLHVSNAAASSLASALVVRYKNPSVRVNQMNIVPAADVTLWPHALGRELSDLVTVKRRPPAGNTISQDVHIEGVAHRVDAPKQMWATTFELSPYQ